MHSVYPQYHNIEKDTLEVYTLGQFMVRRGNRIISSEAKRSYKLWEFLKYIISNRGRNVHGDAIIDNLWPEQDYNDSRNSLHSLIYRLRQLIDSDGNDTIDQSFIIFLLEPTPGMKIIRAGWTQFILSSYAILPGRQTVNPHRL